MSVRINYGSDQLGAITSACSKGHDVIAVTDRKFMSGCLIDAGYGSDALVRLALDMEHMVALRDFLDNLVKEQTR
jgi:hypothetical protein